MKNYYLRKGIIRSRLLATMAAICLMMGLATDQNWSVNAYAEEQEDTAVDDADVVADSSENIDMNSMMQATSHIDALAEPKKGADVIFSFEVGDTMFVTGESDGWYSVMYQGQTGYVKLGNGVTAEVVSVMGDAGSADDLDAEFAAVDQESTMVAEEVVRYHQNRTRSIVWGTIIVLLVIGVFGTGIYTTVKNNKKQKEESDDSSKVEETPEVSEASSSEPESDEVSF